jgi:hypothetical protein
LMGISPGHNSKGFSRVPIWVISLVSVMFISLLR